MVSSITQTDNRAGRIDGTSTAAETLKSRLSVGPNGFSDFASNDQHQHFLEQKGEVFRKLIEDRKDDAPSDDDSQPAGVFSLFAPQTPVVSPIPAPLSAGTSPAVDLTATIEQITTLVRDFNLRDPLLASQSLSCSIQFTEGFSVPTAIAANGPGELQVRISALEADFSIRSGLHIAGLQEALAARFPKHRLRIEFVGEDHGHA